MVTQNALKFKYGWLSLKCKIWRNIRLYVPAANLAVVIQPWALNIPMQYAQQLEVSFVEGWITYWFWYMRRPGKKYLHGGHPILPISSPSYVYGSKPVFICLQSSGCLSHTMLGIYMNATPPLICSTNKCLPLVSSTCWIWMLSKFTESLKTLSLRCLIVFLGIKSKRG